MGHAMAAIKTGGPGSRHRLLEDDAAATRAADEVTRLRDELAAERRGRLDAEEAFRETFAAMTRHQQVGRSGNFRFQPTTGVSRCSSETFRLFGLEPPASLEISWADYEARIHPDDRASVVEFVNAGVAALQPLTFEYRILVDGEVRYIRCDGGPDDGHDGELEYYGVVTDVTERRAAEEQLRRAEAELASALRLASMGELAGSIIHEINQPLAAIGASADAARRWIAAGPERTDRALSSLERVIAECQRAAAVVSGLKTLVREAEPALAPLDVEAMAREVASLVMAELARERVLLRTEFENHLPTVLGDRVQVQQVLMNLIRNAIDAMRLVTHRRVLTLGAARIGGEIVISVTDTGPGVADDAKAALFDALYTTRPGGMGLGLAISRKIALAHGGRLWADPANGGGAAFRLGLPVSEESA